MATTGRRPVLPSVPTDRRFPKQVLVELPFPASRAVIDTLLFAYLDRLSRPPHTIYVLDTSGSMAGPRLASLRAAFANLAGADTSLTGRFARFRKRELVTIIPFTTTATDRQDFTVDTTTPNSPSLSAILRYVDSLQAGGGTAIFSALQQAYQIAAGDPTAHPGYYTTVVLMTDGENNAGIEPSDFLSWLASLPDSARSVKTFAIRFGEADPSQLQQITGATGGQLFDATSGSLQAAFKDIRGYQ